MTAGVDIAVVIAARDVFGNSLRQQKAADCIRYQASLSPVMAGAPAAGRNGGGSQAEFSESCTVHWAERRMKTGADIAVRLARDSWCQFACRYTGTTHQVEAVKLHLVLAGLNTSTSAATARATPAHKHQIVLTELGNSPLTFEIVSGLVSAEMCRADGTGLTIATAGSAASFRITARDSYGNIKASGNEFLAATLSTPTAVSQASLRQEPEGQQLQRDQKVHMLVEPARDEEGTLLPYYSASYTVTAGGWWHLSVTVGGVTPIRDAPTRILVRPARTCATTSLVRGQGLTLATVGRQANFVLTLRDEFGNICARDHTDERSCRSLSYLMAPDVNETILLPVASDTADGDAAHPDQLPESHVVTYTSYRAGSTSARLSLCQQTLMPSSQALTVSVIPLQPDPVCSRAWGQGLTLRTAGVQSAFSVSIRDCFSSGNLARVGARTQQGGRMKPTARHLHTFHVSDVGSGTGGRGVHISFQGDGGDNFHHGAYTRIHSISEIDVLGGGDYLVTQLKTLSGTYSTAVELVAAGALRGMYYQNSDTSFPAGEAAFQRSDSSLSFDWAIFSPAPGFIKAGDGFAVRWKGQVLVPASGEVSWHLRIGPADEASLFLDNRLILMLQPSQTHGWVSMSVTDTRLYDIVIEYRHRTSIARLQLRWTGPAVDNTTQAPVDIPSSRLLSSRGHVQGSPWTTYVHSAAPYADMSLVRGSLCPTSKTLTVLTAGGTAAFTLVARDSFGNLGALSDVHLVGSLDYFSATGSTNDGAVIGNGVDRHAGGEGLAILQQSAAGSASHDWDVLNASTPDRTSASAQSARQLHGTYTRAGSVEVGIGFLTGPGLMATYYIGDLQGHHRHHISRVDLRSGSPFSLSGNVTSGWPWKKFVDPPVAASSPPKLSTGLSTSPTSVYGDAQSLADSAGSGAWVPEDLCDCAAGGCCSPSFSVRWKGWWRPVGRGPLFNVSARLGGVGERVRLWLDNRLLIDAWTSLEDTALTAAHVSATVPLGRALHSLQIEYKHFDGAQGFTLFWSNSSASEGASRVVSSADDTLLWQSSVPGSQACTPSLVLHAPPCSAACSLSGSGLTLATAGIASNFRMTSFDAFGNLAPSSSKQATGAEVAGWGAAGVKSSSSARSEQFRVWLRPVSGDPSHPVRLHVSAVSDTRLGVPGAEWQADSGEVTRAGSHTLHVSLVSCQHGLLATYYDNPDFNDGVDTRTESPSQRGSGGAQGTGDDTNSTLWPGRLGKYLPGANFSVRWEGYVAMDTATEYTFIASVTSSDERLRVWIDHTLLLDQWTSLSSAHTHLPYSPQLARKSALFDLKIEYKEHTGSHGFVLQWYRAGRG